MKLSVSVTNYSWADPTLDVLSAGRAWLGIGAGYNADEANAMGGASIRSAARDRSPRHGRRC
jgi:alkanesulfonate monooxygenase SsuD/methylene tetrahydromethanopterin reductase-like flavin-dependent oxidoreductase (luciferase family)